MDLCCLFIVLSLCALSESQPMTNTFNQTDLQAAVADMRSESYHGFAILLQMLNGSIQLNHDITFFMPGDRELSESSISKDSLEVFLLSHSVPMLLHFNDLVHFPTGTLVPSGIHDRLIRITNHGRWDYLLNNAHVTKPNVCFNSLIKCHGVNGVIEYNKTSYNQEEHPTYAASQMHPPLATAPNFSSHD